MMKKAVLAAALAVAASGAFAQAAVQSSTNVAVTSGTGVVVTPGVPTGAVVTGVRTVEVLPKPTIDGAVVAQAGSTETVNGNQKIVTTRYWVNVPAGANVDDEFERWQRLR